MTVADMFSLGLWRVGRLGSDGGDCLCGRKRWLRSVAHSFIILLYKLMGWIGGNGCWTLPKVI
jgi:hypothetical protein